MGWLDEAIKQSWATRTLLRDKGVLPESPTDLGVMLETVQPIGI
jgi:hypothetical protein